MGDGSAEVPTHQRQHLASGAVATDQLPHQGGGEAEHGHAAVELFHTAQGSGVPGAACGEAFAEALHRFVLEGRLAQGSGGT